MSLTHTQMLGSKGMPSAPLSAGSVVALQSDIDGRMTSAMKREDGPTSTVNQCLRVAYTYARFVGAVISDNAQASRDGFKLTDAYENPNGRETAHGGIQAVKTYPTDLTGAQVSALIKPLVTLGSLAGRVAKLATCADDMPTVERAARVGLAKLANADRSLWGAFVAQGKQLLDGVDAGLIEVDAQHYNRVEDMRRDDATAPTYIRNGKAFQPYLDTGAFVSERDMI